MRLKTSAYQYLKIISRKYLTKVQRNDIQIEQNKQLGKLICSFSGINQIDYTNNTYNIVLIDESEF